MAIKVVVKNNNYEKALSIFKRKVKESNLMFELREREFYKKPSAVKKVSPSFAPFTKEIVGVALMVCLKCQYTLLVPLPPLDDS